MATDTKPENASPANGTVDTSLVDSVFSMVGQNTAPMVTRTPVRSKTEVPAAVLRQPARVRRPVPAETEPAEEPTTWYDWIGKAALAVGVVCARTFSSKQRQILRLIADLPIPQWLPVGRQPAHDLSRKIFKM